VTTPDFRNTPSTTNLEKEEIVDARENDGHASMLEQVNRPNPWRKMAAMMMMMMMMMTTTTTTTDGLGGGGGLTPGDSLERVSLSDQSLKPASVSHEDGSPLHEMYL
jgi:hypothetical protein